MTTRHEPAIGIFSGPAHVLVTGNAAFCEMVEPSAFGKPMRETYTDPLWDAVHRAMDAVLMDGLPRQVQLPSGPLTLCRLPDVQGRPGIGSKFALRQPEYPPRPEQGDGTGVLVGAR